MAPNQYKKASFCANCVLLLPTHTYPPGSDCPECLRPLREKFL